MRAVVARRELLGTTLAAPLCFSSRLAGQSQERQRKGPIRAVNVQFKVEVRGPGGDLVPADFERVREIMVKSGYQGWVALEYEAAGNPRIEISRHVQRLQSLFERCA